MTKEKLKRIILFLFIFVAIFSIIIKKETTDLDELWNYNTARVIAEGLIPYKDISMITTPLLPMVTAIFLKLIANELIVSRILAALLCTGILYMFFKILKLLIKEENVCLIATALVGILFRQVYFIDYNYLALFFTLIILYNELKRINTDEIHNRKYDLVIRNFSRTYNLYKAKCGSNSINCNSSL